MVEIEEESFIRKINQEIDRLPRYSVIDKIKWWCEIYHPPYVILFISLIQFVTFSLQFCTPILVSLRFDPNQQWEIWRFFSYMFVHDSAVHLLLNVALQCILAAFLEAYQGGGRVGLLYGSGGCLGALGAACIRSDIVVGASAGVYALLTSHISLTATCYKSLNHKLYRLFAVVVMITCDIAFSIVHIRNKRQPMISEGAHLIGGISGLILGLVLFGERNCTDRKNVSAVFLIGLVLLVIFVDVLVMVNLRVRKCTPESQIDSKYVYVC